MTDQPKRVTESGAAVPVVPGAELSAADRRRDQRSLDRLVNFSDAVFAIAITRLALDVRLPNIDSVAARPPLAPQLVVLAPSLFAFTLSFVVIGGYWVAHHRLFKFVERYDTRLLWLNLLTLFCIALLPFPTQVIAKYGDTVLGVEIYAGAMTLTGLSVLATMGYAYSAHLTAAEADWRIALTKSAITPIVFASSMVVGLWNPIVASNMWWLVAIAFFVVDPILNSRWGGPAAKLRKHKDGDRT
jgi:uncharacterized membrane protein